MSDKQEQHVVITDNYDVLRYPTLAKAKAMYLDRKVVFTGVKDLVERISNHELLMLLRRYSDEAPHGKLKNSEEIAKVLWPLLLRHAKIENPWLPKPQPGTKAHDKLIDAITVSPLYQEYKRDRFAKQLPPQAETLMNYFVDNIPEGGCNEQQLEILVRQCHADGILKTKQDPWRIFQYYRPTLFGRGLLTVD